MLTTLISQNLFRRDSNLEKFSFKDSINVLMGGLCMNKLHVTSALRTNVHIMFSLNYDIQPCTERTRPAL